MKKREEMKMSKLKRTLAIALAIILALSVAACSAGKTSSPDLGYNAGKGDYVYADSEESARADAPAAMPAAPPSADAFAPDGKGYDGDYGYVTGGMPINVPSEFSDKIIYSASVGVEAIDFDRALDDTYKLITRYGAFIENSYIGGVNYETKYYGYSPLRSADFTIRVPYDVFSEMLTTLDTIGNVVYRRDNAQNVSAEYTDVESRLKMYRVEESRLFTYLEKAETVADMIEIEARLSEVRYNIENLTSSLKNLDNHIEYSTVTLSISEVEKLTETEPVHRTYWQQVGDGLKSTTKKVGVFFTNLFKGIIVNIPIIIILAVIVAAVIVIVKVGKRRSARARDKAALVAPEDQNKE
jgi:hypothetical protein